MARKSARRAPHPPGSQARATRPANRLTLQPVHQRTNEPTNTTDHNTSWRMR